MAVWNLNIKQNRPISIISTRCDIESARLRNAKKPSFTRSLKSANFSENIPPSTSMYSCGILKGASSNPTDPGEFISINPKSMCVKCPWRSRRILPLCLSFS